MKALECLANRAMAKSSPGNRLFVVFLYAAHCLLSLFHLQQIGLEAGLYMIQFVAETAVPTAIMPCNTG